MLNVDIASIAANFLLVFSIVSLSGLVGLVHGRGFGYGREHAVADALQTVVGIDLHGGKSPGDFADPVDDAEKLVGGELDGGGVRTGCATARPG